MSVRDAFKLGTLKICKITTLTVKYNDINKTKISVNYTSERHTHSR